MIRPDLEHAFSATRYRVALAGRRLTLTIDRPCPAALADRLRGRPGWLITAYNPGARALDAATNQARAAVLRAWVAQRGLACLDSVNVAPSEQCSDEQWPDEPGLLVYGLEEGLARALGRRFGQLAMVAVRSHAPVALVWLG